MGANLVLLQAELDWANRELLKYEGFDDALHRELIQVLTDTDDFLVEIAALSNAGLPNDSRFAAAAAAVRRDDRQPFHVKRLEEFAKIIKDIKQRHADDKTEATCHIPSTPNPARCTDLDKGFNGSFCRVNSLLLPADCKEIRIAAIVGAAGSGKTVLAKEIFESTIVQPLKPIKSVAELDEPFNVKIWVSASACLSSDDLLSQIRKDVGRLLAEEKTNSSVVYLNDQIQQPDITSAGHKSSSAEIINLFLKNKRFLLIIDDLCSSGINYKDLIPAFPASSKNSRVIVTTTLHSVAREFASGGYYIFPLQPLSEDCSKDLFCRQLRDKEITNPEKDRATTILHKCGGSPIAIACAKKYVLKKTNPFLNERCCKEICEQLDKVVLTKDAVFTDLARMHMRCYESLDDYDERSCLLAFGFYPRGHLIRMNAFARKLGAESLVTEQNARECLLRLVDRSIISNVDQKYQIEGATLQLARYKVLARNMATIIDEDGILWQCDPKVLGGGKISCRRLIIHSSPKNSGNGIPEAVDLSLLRSLTVIKCTDPSYFINISKMDFNCFSKMRVLDLQSCSGFTDNTFTSICQMTLLKYLDLKGSDVAKIPKSVERLVHLETIDIRKTMVRTIPLEVITLPKVKYVFGQFDIPPLAGKEKYIINFLKDNSNLHTVAGLCVSDISGAAAVVLNARSLRRLKIFGDKPVMPSGSATKRPGLSCFAGASRDKCSDFDSSIGDLVESLRARRTHLEQLSISSSAVFKCFSALPMNDSVMSCFKVKGQIEALPTSQFQTISMLTLYSTGMSAQALAEGLQRLEYLEHLKLGKEHDETSWIGDFKVENGGFPALREFCLIGPKSYPNIKIGHGGMSVLVSLQLLCPMRDVTAIDDRQMDLADDDEIAAADPEIRVDGISHLRLLDEVILHYSSDNAVITVWESLARAHVNLPCVRRQRKPLMPSVNEF